MEVEQKKESISKFCRAQIRTINGKKARIEKIIDEYFLGFAIRKKETILIILIEKRTLIQSYLR